MSSKVSVLDWVIVARLVDIEAVVPYYLGIVTCRSFGRSCQLVGIEIHCKDSKLLPNIIHTKNQYKSIYKVGFVYNHVYPEDHSKLSINDQAAYPVTRTPLFLIAFLKEFIYN